MIILLDYAFPINRLYFCAQAIDKKIIEICIFWREAKLRAFRID